MTRREEAHAGQEPAALEFMRGDAASDFLRPGSGAMDELVDRPEVADEAEAVAE